MPRSIFEFVLGVPRKLGVGIADRALARPTTLPIQSMYGPRYNVQRNLAPNSPGFAKYGQQLVPVSLLGTSGAGFQPTFNLTRLAERG